MLTNLHLGAKVIGTDNQNLGRVKILVAEPGSDRVTHFVVDHSGYDKRQVVVRVDLITAISNDGQAVQVNLTGDQVQRLPDYIERDYVTYNTTYAAPNDNAAGTIDSTRDIYPLGAPNLQSGFVAPSMSAVVNPAGTQAADAIRQPHEEIKNVPEDSLIIREGVQVDATDGKIGVVKGVQLDPASGRVVSFMVEKGLIFTENVTVPVELVDSADDDLIYLKVSKGELGSNYSNQSGSTNSNYNTPA